MPAQDLTLAQWVADTALRFEGVDLRIHGDTDDESASSLVDAMLEAELAVAM
jgi:hypothetical protein